MLLGPRVLHYSASLVSNYDHIIWLLFCKVHIAPMTFTKTSTRKVVRPWPDQPDWLYSCCACVHAWDNNTYMNGIAVVVTQVANNINGKVKGGP